MKGSMMASGFKTTQETINQIRELASQGLASREIATRLRIGKDQAQKYSRGHRPHETGIKPQVMQSDAPIPHNRISGLWYEKYGILWDDGDVLELENMPLNLMAAACLQVPFEHKDFVTFMGMVKVTTSPEFTVLGGDLLDILFAKPHFGMPDDMSPTEEIRRGQEVIAELGRVFPNAIVLTSNHVEGRLKEMRRNGRTPEAFMRQWRDIYGVPEGWKIVRTLIAGRFCFEHGHETGKGTKTGIREETVRRYKRFDRGGLTMIRAHRHTLSGCVSAHEWEDQRFSRGIYYMGCGMDEKQVSYSGAGVWNTVLSIRDGAVIPYPMEVNKEGKWTQRIINGLLGK